MTPNGLFAFLNGPVVLSFSYFETVLVANHVEWQDLSVIILVTFFFLKITLDKSL